MVWDGRDSYAHVRSACSPYKLIKGRSNQTEISQFYLISMIFRYLYFIPITQISVSSQIRFTQILQVQIFLKTYKLLSFFLFIFYEIEMMSMTKIMFVYFQKMILLVVHIIPDLSQLEVSFDSFDPVISECKVDWKIFQDFEFVLAPLEAVAVLITGPWTEVDWWSLSDHLCQSPHPQHQPQHTRTSLQTRTNWWWWQQHLNDMR